jgi:hypothetical protein
MLGSGFGTSEHVVQLVLVLEFGYQQVVQHFAMVSSNENANFCDVTRGVLCDEVYVKMAKSKNDNVNIDNLNILMISNENVINNYQNEHALYGTQS